jgi:hypothetical protein
LKIAALKSIDEGSMMNKKDLMGMAIPVKEIS